MNQIDYNALNARIEQRIEERKRALKYFMYFFSVFIFIVLALVGWAIYAADNEPIAGLIMLTTAGVMTLIFNGVSLAASTGAMDRAMRREVMRQEMNVDMMEMLLDQAREKAKRQDTVLLDNDSATDESFIGLSDDGELITQRRKR